MRFLCLVYFAPELMEALSPREAAALTRDSLDYDDVLRKTGRYIASAALQPVAAATTVRRRTGKVLKTDGPFAETKEHLGGFILIEAADRDEAAAIAAEIPMARMGCIEVRPILELSRE